LAGDLEGAAFEEIVDGIDRVELRHRPGEWRPAIKAQHLELDDADYLLAPSIYPAHFVLLLTVSYRLFRNVVSNNGDRPMSFQHRLILVIACTAACSWSIGWAAYTVLF
jgi:hypothetical protein